MPLNNAQYEELMRTYDEIRERHRHELEARTEEIAAKIPGIALLNDRIGSASLEAAKKRILDPKADLSAFYKELEEIADQRIVLLQEHGYPGDYLNPTYDCPLCHDTGLVDGKRCSCFRKKEAALLYKDSKAADLLEKENFRHFSFDWYSDTIKSEATGRSARETAEDAVKKARLFLSRIGEEDNNLFLCGNTGVGKSFLSHCIMKEALDRSYSALYFTAGELFDLLADARFGRSQESLTRELPVYECDLLVIDDLGTELTNSFVAVQLFRLLNDRILRKRSTIISTNLTLNELSGIYTERVFSRITSHYTIIKLIGEDIRIQKKLKGGSV